MKKFNKFSKLILNMLLILVLSNINLLSQNISNNKIRTTETLPDVDIVINEIMYNPSSELGDDNYYEYLELYNNKGSDVDISGWSFTNGFDFTFEAGTIIKADSFIVVAKNPDTIIAYFGISNIVGPYTGNLGNGGEMVELSDAGLNMIDFVEYNDSGDWPNEPDGNGPSLELINPDLNNSLAGSWAASLVNNGTPGIINSVTTQDEIITVVNPNGGEYWQQGSTNNITWTYANFSGNVKIELLTDKKNREILAASVPVSDESWTWNIPSDQTTGNNYIIKISDTDDEEPSDESDDTFSIIEPVDVPALVITEIMYNPPESGTDSLEFIEIYNNDSDQVNLQGIYFSDGITGNLPSVILNPDEFIIMAVDSIAMFNTFGVTAYQWTSGALKNSGELIKLKDNPGNTIDFVEYGDSDPWPASPDGNGPSLTFCNPDIDNSLPEYWTASVEFAAVNVAGDSIFATPGEHCESFGITNHKKIKIDPEIYPNPNKGIFLIKIDKGNYDIKIYSFVGELIYQTYTNNKITEFNLSNMSNGIYFVKIHNLNTNKIITKKLIIN